MIFCYSFVFVVQPTCSTFLRYFDLRDINDDGILSAMEVGSQKQQNCIN